MIDMDHVSGLIRRTVAATILPRFRNLATGEIAEKGPGDLVTIADTEAEEMLTGLLTEAWPGTLVVGEEAVSRDESVLERLKGDVPVWVIDPVDGTLNFSEGVPVFGTILAYVVRGETRAGWIYDPIGDVMVSARQGQGAWEGARRLMVDKATPLARMSGTAYWNRADWYSPDPALVASGRVGKIRNHRCSAADYQALALGRQHFVLSVGSKPWDHAAGVLITHEAGGTAAFLDGTPYGFDRLESRMLAAATAETAEAIREAVGVRD